MLAYRVCKVQYAADDGTGAARVGGRWNSPGHAALYCGTSQAGAMLEILAHASGLKLPGAHHVAVFEIPEHVPIRTIDATALPGWDSPGMTESRAFGDAWLASRASAVLVIPSIVAHPYDRNVVIDPTHPDFARIVVHAPVPLMWDARLFGV